MLIQLAHVLSEVQGELMHLFDAAHGLFHDLRTGFGLFPGQGRSAGSGLGVSRHVAHGGVHFAHGGRRFGKPLGGHGRAAVRLLDAPRQAAGNAGNPAHGFFQGPRHQGHALVLVHDELFGLLQGCHVHIEAEPADAGLVLVVDGKNIGQHVDFPPLVAGDDDIQITEVLAVADAFAHRRLTRGIIIKEFRQGFAQTGLHAVVNLQHVQAGLIGAGGTLLRVHQQIGHGQALKHAARQAALEFQRAQRGVQARVDCGQILGPEGLGRVQAALGQIAQPLPHSLQGPQKNQPRAQAQAKGRKQRGQHGPGQCRGAQPLGTKSRPGPGQNRRQRGRRNATY